MKMAAEPCGRASMTAWSGTAMRVATLLAVAILLSACGDGGCNFPQLPQKPTKTAGN